jgi:hypothetical protein
MVYKRTAVLLDEVAFVSVKNQDVLKQKPRIVDSVKETASETSCWLVSTFRMLRCTPEDDFRCTFGLPIDSVTRNSD